MPTGEQHSEMSFMRTGKKYKEVHSYIDEPCKWLGSFHRQERHDFKTIAYILNKYGEEAAMEATYHMLEDMEKIND